MVKYGLCGILIVVLLAVTAAVLKKTGVLHKRSGKNNRNGWLKDIPEHDLKSISILKKLYRFDFENKRVEIPMEFDAASDIMDPSVSGESNIAVSSDFAEALMDKIRYIPKQFRVNIALSFRRFDGCSGEAVLRAVQDKLEGCYNMVMKEAAKKYFKTLTFIIVCIILSMIATIPITVDYTLGVAGVYSLIIGILLENAAVLILWQAGYTIFDILEQKGIGNASLYRRINQISLTDENNGTLVRQQAELFEYCPLFRKREKIAHVVLLLVTAYMVSICVIEMIAYVLDRFNLSQTDQIIFFAEWVIILFFTYTNISFYFDRGNIVRHALGVSAGAAAVFAIYNVGRLIYIHVRAIPFDYDDFLFTYMMLSAANTVCICVIRKERERRAGHLLSVCFEEKPIP